MSRVTASKVGLLSYCQAWARPEMVWENRSSDSAERGTRFHAAIAGYTETRERSEVGEDIREEYAHACAWVDSLQLPAGAALLTETAFAWDPVTDTAEVIGKDRDYSKASGRLCGTADLVMVAMVDGRAVAAMVWDWKTGDGSGSGPQLRTLGLMVARAMGIEDVTVAALEARSGGVFEVAREELDGFTLAMFAGELAEHLSFVPRALPVAGSHCGELYCPARLSCPLGTEATSQVLEVIPADALAATREYRLTDPIETPEHAAWAVDVIRLVGAKLDAIKDSIKAKIPQDGWKLEDGRVLRETRATIEAFDKHKAMALCKQLGATDEQIGSCFYTFEKSNGLRVSGGHTKPRARRGRAA